MTGELTARRVALAPFDWPQSEQVRTQVLLASIALTDVRAWAVFNTTNDNGLAAATKLLSAAQAIHAIARGAVDASP